MTALGERLIGLLGLVLAIFLWELPATQFAAATLYESQKPASKTEVALPFRQIEPQCCTNITLDVPFNYAWPQSTLYRIIPDLCMVNVSVNDTKIEDANDQITHDSLCSRHVVTAEYAPFLKPDGNRMQILAKTKEYDYGVDIVSVRSTPRMLLITLLAMTYPILWYWRHRSWTMSQFVEWARVHYTHLLIMLTILPLAIVLRLQFMDFKSADWFLFLQTWMDHIQHFGLESYRHAFTNYAPLYTYFLGLLDLYFPITYPLYSIKCLTFVGEAFAAFWVYRLVALHYRDQPNSLMPFTAAMTLLLTPSVLTNGSMSAQCDIWYTSFLLAAVYYILQKRSNMACLFGGLAYAFKQQSLFLAPFVLVMVLRRDLSWKSLWILPAVYLALTLPCLALGRPFVNLMGIYWYQAMGHASGPINFNAANPYLYLWTRPDAAEIKDIGQIISLFIALAFVYINKKFWRGPLSVPHCLLVATFSAGLMPFVLPMMHDRYFFVADIFSFVLGFVAPRWLPLTVLFQSASLIAPPAKQVPRLGGWLGWIQVQGLSTGVWINAAALTLLLILSAKYLWLPSLRNASQKKALS